MKAKIISASGILAVCILLLSSLVTGIAYRGRAGQRFSPFNHFISELGQPGVSRLSAFFNVSMMTCGVLAVVFMAGIALLLKRRAVYLAASTGILAGIAALLVGAFPINHGSVHTGVSIFFFYASLTSVIIFAVIIAADRGRLMPRWLLIPGFASFALFSLLLLVIRASAAPTAILDPNIVSRPDIWAAAVLEWLSVLSLAAWVLSFSIFVLRRCRNKEEARRFELSMRADQGGQEVCLYENDSERRQEK